MPEDFYPGSLKSGTTIGATSVIAEGVFFKGNLLGDKNLSVEGKIEGRIDLRSADVIVRETGIVKANIVADKVTIEGKVYGDVTGMQQVSVGKNGAVYGNITSPRVSLDEGCTFQGKIDMDPTALNAVVATLKAVEKVVAQEDQPEAPIETLAEALSKAANE